MAEKGEAGCQAGRSELLAFPCSACFSDRAALQCGGVASRRIRLAGHREQIPPQMSHENPKVVRMKS